MTLHLKYMYIHLWMKCLFIFNLFCSITDTNIPMIFVCSSDIIILQCIINYFSVKIKIHIFVTKISEIMIFIRTVCYRGFFLVTSRVKLLKIVLIKLQTFGCC